jgi:hypothetical protein
MRRLFSNNEEDSPLARRNSFCLRGNMLEELREILELCMGMRRWLGFGLHDMDLCKVLCRDYFLSFSLCFGGLVPYLSEKAQSVPYNSIRCFIQLY